MLLQKHRGGTDTQIKFARHFCNFSIVSLVIYCRPSYPHSLEADHSHNKVANHSNRFSSVSLVLYHRVICAPLKLIIDTIKWQTIWTDFGRKSPKHSRFFSPSHFIPISGPVVYFVFFLAMRYHTKDEGPCLALLFQLCTSWAYPSRPPPLYPHCKWSWMQKIM